MKAIIYTEYGQPEVFQLKEIEKPAPKENEVLIKVYAASINSYDWRLLTASPFLVRLMGGGFLKPKNTILGADVAGRVEAVGKNVTKFKPGDEVFGDLAVSGGGGYAEFVCASENVLALKPANATFEEAASIPMAAITALQGLRNMGNIQKGQKVLIHGASGGVGSFAVQIAKSFGAEVTAVCSTRNMDRICTLGADFVIDYTQEDFTKNGQLYDLILGANGFRSIFKYKHALKPNGIYIMTGGSMAQMFQALLLGSLISMTGKKKMVSLTTKPNPNDLVFLKELIEAGKVKPIIDRLFKLSEVPEAFRYYEKEHARGKIVITVEQKI